MCTPGFLCAQGMSIIYLCDPGSFVSYSGDFCTPCPRGFYCPLTNRPPKPCPDG